MIVFQKRKKHLFRMNFSSRCFITVLLLLGMNLTVHAQRTRVTGQVTDAENAPLPGASILIQGSTRGVTTDLDGSYSIEVAPANKLVFTFVGFEDQVIEVSGKTVINVMLQEKSSELSEVTVVAYGKQRKESVIGAISTVSVKDLRMPVGKVSTSLAGQMAGVVAVQRSGEPGAGADFWIRGIATFGTNNKPLILVDGIERELDLVDTEDIETFSILKDATATAIYGVRGANGVLLINTRRGVEGKPKISARMEYGILSPTKMPVMANAEQYIDMFNDVHREINKFDFYSPELREKYINKVDLDLYPNVDWLKEVYKDRATSQRVNLNATGGGKNMRYYVAGSLYNENGIFNAVTTEYNPSMRWTKYSFRSNLDIDFTSSTTLNLNLSTQYDVKNRPNSKVSGTDYLFIDAYTTNPVSIPPIYSDGSVARTPGSGLNPYNRLNKTGYVEEFNNNAQTLLGITQDFSEIITQGLTANIKFSWDVVNQDIVSRILSPPTYYASERDEEGNLILTESNVNGSDYLTFGRSNKGTRALYTEASITYNRVFADIHRVGGLFLFNMGSRTNMTPGDITDAVPNRHLGIAGRLTYSFMDKYFVEGNFGYNGSENFAPKKRYGFFPSIAAGYLISNEEFFEPLRPAISLLKLKASHGKAGNDKISDTRRFAFNTDMKQDAEGWIFGANGFNNFRTAGISTGYPGNDMVGWEESTKTNLGIELGLFHKLKLQTDYFYELRTNIFLLRQSVPSIAGVNENPYVNVGEMKNRGIDASFEYDDHFGDWFVSARANFTYNRNQAVYNDKPTPVYRYADEIGRPWGQQIGLVAVGLFESQEDIDKWPVQNVGKPRPGDVKYRDINGDGFIDELDRVAIGRSTVPEINYGFGVSAMWKNFDASVFFAGVNNVTIIINGSPVNGFESTPQQGNVFADIAINRWTEENPHNNPQYPRMAINVSQNNRQPGTHKLRDISFMRFKNAEIGYTLPRDFTKRLRMNTCRFYVQGVNLLTFTKFKLWDPELESSQGASYPNMRNINLGLNLNF